MSHVLNGFRAREIKQGYGMLIEQLPDIVEIGRNVAYNDAISHRNFLVGDVAVGIAPGHEELLLIPRANYKIKHTDDDVSSLTEEHDVTDQELHDVHGIPREVPKVCAEMATILGYDADDEFRGPGYDDEPLDFEGVNKETVFFIAHITIGTTDPDEIRSVTQMENRTLPPCEQCVQAVYRGGNPHTSNSTLAISAGIYEDILQVRTPRDLDLLYKRGFEDTTEEQLGSLDLLSIAFAKNYYERKAKSYPSSGAHRPARIFSAIAAQALKNESLMK